MLTYKQWLQEHGKESCLGCRYHDARRGRCFYKGSTCVRYGEYRREEERRQKGEQLELF